MTTQCRKMTDFLLLLCILLKILEASELGWSSREQYMGCRHAQGPRAWDPARRGAPGVQAWWAPKAPGVLLRFSLQYPGFLGRAPEVLAEHCC